MLYALGVQSLSHWTTMEVPWALLLFPRVLQRLEGNLSSLGWWLVFPDKGKFQAERGANLFISKHKPDSSCDMYTGSSHCERELGRRAGGGMTKAAQDEKGLFIFR